MVEPLLVPEKLLGSSLSENRCGTSLPGYPSYGEVARHSDLPGVPQLFSVWGHQDQPVCTICAPSFTRGFPSRHTPIRNISVSLRTLAGLIYIFDARAGVERIWPMMSGRL